MDGHSARPKPSFDEWSAQDHNSTSGGENESIEETLSRVTKYEVQQKLKFH
jgi:hypothetical protein